MKTQLHTLRTFIRNEPAGFTARLAKNSAKYVIQKYLLGKKFAVQPIHNYQMKLNLHDPGISRTLLLINDREREHSYLLRQIISPQTTVLDLGANIGYYALMESQLVGEKGQVIAIEPHPINFTLLQDNIALNHSQNIIPIHAAVTDQDGTTNLHVSLLSNVHSVLPSVNYSAAKTIQVPSISLKKIAQQYPKITVIRMDIEGFETVILNSLIAINQYQAFTPTILFELHVKKYTEKSLETLLKSLSSIGYSVRYIATSNTKLIRSLGLTITTSIPTDGKIRHILQNPTLSEATALIPTARCLVLATS